VRSEASGPDLVAVEKAAEPSAGGEEEYHHGLGPCLAHRGATPNVRVFGYCHLMPADLHAPRRSGIFFDPADTEVGIWATADLLKPGCTVLDLGSGSGAAASAVARAGAGHVHGLDISQNSVLWASQHYASQTNNERVTFAVADYANLSSSQLLDSCPFNSPPTVIAANPPYVPVSRPRGSKKVSIDGGSDGLHLVRLIVCHAAAMRSDLGLTIGSYSSPLTAARVLDEFGYKIFNVTLSALRLGDYTMKNMERVLALEARGKGPLLRAEDGVVYYIVVGLSCRRVPNSTVSSSNPTLTAEELLALLQLACQSRTVSLDAFEASSVAWPVPIRILVLPDEPLRHHC
jgi:release factor glutamine methyltransferase